MNAEVSVRTGVTGAVCHRERGRNAHFAFHFTRAAHQGNKLLARPADVWFGQLERTLSVCLF